MICCCAFAPAPTITPPAATFSSPSLSPSLSLSPSPLPLPLQLTPASTMISHSLTPMRSRSNAPHSTAPTTTNTANIHTSTINCDIMVTAAMAELDVVQCASLRKPLAATKTTSLPLPLLSHKPTTRSVSGGAATPSSSAAESMMGGQTLCWRNTLRRMFQRK